ncbi:MAG: BCCT family transporter [Eggerthellaceae bacterium]
MKFDKQTRDRILGHSLSVYSAEDDDIRAKRVEKIRERREKSNPVLNISLGLVITVVALYFLFPEASTSTTAWLQGVISQEMGWFYLLLVGLLVFTCLVLMISPVGRIHLGDPDSKPEHSFLSWIAMLFSAGMGIGLVFYGAAEPLSHFAVSAPEAPVESTQAMADAMRYSFFHWGFSAWAIYGIVALALAYFKFRKKEKSLLSTTLKPLFGKAMEGKPGKLVDSLAVFATVIGVSTSLGLGAMQINGGLDYLFGVGDSRTLQLIIIAVATLLFISSAVSGIDKGVKKLSDINLILAIVLMVFAIALGPHAEVFDVFVTTTGTYITNFVNMSFNAAPFDPAQREWLNSWTIFYWAWWIAWSPFVGVFIARISKGRTIREFLFCVLLVPTIFSCLWFSTFGTMAMDAQAAGANIAALPTEQALFATFAQLPWGMVLSVVALALILSFFVTSADSATYVLSMISEGGNLFPRKRTKIIWGVTLSVLAAVLLTMGGLQTLQNVLIISALPFAFVILLIVIALTKELAYERERMGLGYKPTAIPDKDHPFRSYEEDGELAEEERFGL